MKPSAKLLVVAVLVVVVVAIVVISVKRPARKEEGAPVAPTKPDVAARREQRAKTPTSPTRTRRVPTGPAEIPAARTGDEMVLAKVNGVAITAYNTFGPVDIERLMETDTQFPKQLLDQAIERELLHQYAEEIGLDQLDEYKEAEAREKSRAEHMEIQRLAMSYEHQNKELAALRESLEPTEAEVEQYYQENQERYARWDPEQAKDGIRGMLIAERYEGAYKDWVGRTMAEVEITVNGRAIPAEVLKESLDSTFPGGPPVPGRGGPPEAIPSNALLDFVRAAAGATDDSDAARELLMEAEIQVGTNVVNLEELLDPLGMMAPPGVEVTGRLIEGVLRGPALINSLKMYVLADKARQEGVNTLDATGPGGPVPPPIDPGLHPGGPWSRDTLAEMVWQRENLVSVRDIEVSEAEIDEHLKKGEAQYRRLMRRPGGKNRARTVARRRISQEKLGQKREAFTQGLWSQAMIEILDERLR